MEIFDFFLAIDKQKHIIVSFCLFLWIFSLRKLFLKNKGFFRVVAFTIRDVFIIGILKESYDLLGYWNPELWDILANSLGIIIPIYLYYLIKESKEIENNNFFKYEKVLIKTLKQKLIFIWKKLMILTLIKYEQLFYKQKILLTLRNKKETDCLSKSFIDLRKILKYFIIFSVVWLLNLIILLIRVPFIAFFDTIELFFKLIKYTFSKNQKALI